MQPITIKMIPPKVAFFFFYASVGCYAPFMPVFLVSTGLTVRETGLILGLAFVAGTLFPFLFGLIADATRFKMVLFSSILLGYTALHFSLPFAAYVATPTPSRNRTMFNTTIVTNTNNSNITMASHLTAKTKFNSEFSSNLFFTLLVITVLGRGFQLSFTGILDSIISNAILHLGTSENYGQQVMFSGLGLALGSVVSTAVSDKYPALKYSSYMGNFYTFLPCVVPLVPVLYLIYQQTSWKVKSTQVEQNEISNPVPVETPDEGSEEILNVVLGGMDPGIPHAVDEVPSEGPEAMSDGVTKPRNGENSKMQKLLGICKDPDNVVVLITLVVCGLLRTVSISFVYLFMREEIGASKIEMGLAEGVRSLTTFVIFLVSNFLIRNFHGPTICMGTGLAMYCISLLAVSFVRTPWIAILLQAVRGAGFGIFRAANVRYTSDITPKEIYNTMFLLNIGLFIGAPGVVGNFAGGILYYQLTGVTLFQGSCVLGCVWLLFMIVFFMVRRRMKNIVTTFQINELQDCVNSTGLSGQRNENFDTRE